MSQIIVAQNTQGIVLAAENRAVQLDESGREISFPMERLIPLTAHSAVLAAGAAEGVEIGKTLKRFIQEEGLLDIQDIYGTSLAFLSTEYEKFMRKRCELLPIDPIHHLSFILAGKTDKDEKMAFRLYYLWTKKKLPQLDGDEISYAFSYPRRMGLEFQLNKMAKDNTSPKEMLDRIKKGIAQLKEKGEVSSPFSFAIITREGLQPQNP